MPKNKRQQHWLNLWFKNILGAKRCLGRVSDNALLSDAYVTFTQLMLDTEKTIEKNAWVQEIQLD